MTDTMIDIAKKKDIDGAYAKVGMRWFIAHHFGVNMQSKAVNYILDTYLECIGMDLFKWLRTPLNESPMILTRETLEKNYADILAFSTDLEEVANIFACVYAQEFWVDEKEDCLYTTVYQYKDRKTLNLTGIAMEYERMTVLLEYNIISENDINTALEIIAEYGFDIEKQYEIHSEDIEETAQNILKELNHLFCFN